MNGTHATEDQNLNYKTITSLQQCNINQWAGTESPEIDPHRNGQLIPDRHGAKHERGAGRIIKVSTEQLFLYMKNKVSPCLRPAQRSIPDES